MFEAAIGGLFFCQNHLRERVALVIGHPLTQVVLTFCYGAGCILS